MKHIKIHSLSDASKMPGKSWGISPEHCKTGTKLRQIPDSVCSICYACKGQYQFKSAKNAHEMRLQAYNLDPAGWVEGMVETIGRMRTPFFRWFDSGDLQSMDMLRDIFEVVRRTPHVKHWMPTKEKGLVKRYLRETDQPTTAIPKNMVIRISGAMIGGKAPDLPNVPGLRTSTVHSDKKAAHGRVCPAPLNNGQCGNCRACWNRRIKNVSYCTH